MFFEHRGLLAGRDEGPRHDTGASSFLYPFLSESEHDLDAVLADVAGSVLAKAGEAAALRATTLARIARCSRRRPRRYGRASTAGGTCSRSATAARPPTRWTSSPTCVARARRCRRGARSTSTEDPSIITAVANDVGVELDLRAPGDRLRPAGRRAAGVLHERRLGNVLAALAQARRRGLVTIAFVGYDGGRILADELADHVVVTRSEHIPRIQEAQASAYHVLRGAGRAGARRRRRAVARASASRAWSRASASALRATASRRELGAGRARPQRRRAASRRGRGRARRRSSAFLDAPRAEAPPLARRRGVARGRRRAAGRARLRDRRQRRGRARRGARRRRTLRPAPTACASCCDPADRRFRYPFVNCTNCGPRFTIVARRPLRPAAHDDGRLRDVRRAARPSTTTRPTAASTPSPTRCPVCGPRLRLVDATAAPARRRRRSRAARAAARRARSSRSRGSAATTSPAAPTTRRAVARLRARKHREDNPFALMAADVAAARGARELGDAEDGAADVARAADRARRARRPGAAVAAAVAPGDRASSA